MPPGARRPSTRQLRRIASWPVPESKKEDAAVRRHARNPMRAGEHRQSRCGSRGRNKTRRISLCQARTPLQCSRNPYGFLFQEHRMHFTSCQFAGFLSLFAGLLMPAPVLAQQKSDLPHPKTLEELQKAMKDVLDRSEERRVGKECRSRWWQY